MINRPTRRPSRIRPPLRGRSAAVPPLGAEGYVKPVVRLRPPRPGGFVGKPPRRSECDQIHPSFIAFYHQWSGLFRVLNRPWQWFVGLILIVILAVYIGTVVG
ncbi:hypothetical protein [Acaryochloris sp. IP29b_bin.148]|uniref:hypothetical protein n=1 Tax=Acaryochloris sp. IP29b_bin.148 TaxID=2969218 RepID=UPI00262BF0EB|nr:hypothetical protein [Acaryochloris sp. IP29b_bin.148]